MIPYPAPLEFFISFFNALPVPFAAFVVTMMVLALGVRFIIWLVGQILG